MKKFFLFGCLIALTFGVALFSADAQTVFVRREIDGIVLATGAINACRTTDWIVVSKDREITFEVVYDDGALGGVTTTDITMVCRGTNNGAVPPAYADAVDIHGLLVTCAAGVCTARSDYAIYRHTPTIADGNVERWFWTIDRIPATRIRCQFCGVGSVVADTLQVSAMRATP
jgi:hypothetical protein